MGRRLSNFEFAQLRVRAERNHYKQEIIRHCAQDMLTNPYCELDEQDILELNRLIDRSRSPLESEDV